MCGSNMFEHVYSKQLHAICTCMLLGLLYQWLPSKHDLEAPVLEIGKLASHTLMKASGQHYCRQCPAGSWQMPPVCWPVRRNNEHGKDTSEACFLLAGNPFSLLAIPEQLCNDWRVWLRPVRRIVPAQQPIPQPGALLCCLGAHNPLVQQASVCTLSRVPACTQDPCISLWVQGGGLEGWRGSLISMDSGAD